MLMFVGKSLTTRVALDAATIAWVNAVVGAGGTVSDARKILVNDLIVGLKGDGIFTKLDRLWLFAMENTFEALVDLIAAASATKAGSPTFTVDRGYTGTGAAADYINANIDSTQTTQFISGSANIFGWSNTAGGDHGALCGGGVGHTEIYPEFDTDTFLYYSLNSSEVTGPTNVSATTGLYLVNRTDTTNISVDINGTQFTTAAQSDFGTETGNFVALNRSVGGVGTATSRQCSCLGFGGGLSGGDRTNIYSRIRTYMTAVGVP